MSKLDAQRAMREAKYERDQRAAAVRNGTSPVRSRPAPPVAPPLAASHPDAGSVDSAAADVDAAAGSTASCGHKSMNGRACTREAGHSEKSHRYS